MNRKESFKRFHKQLTTSSLRELHALIARLLREEDSQPKTQHQYGVREHSDFREQADVIEAELSTRSETFTPIDWSAPAA
jgi:hypothetical protein